MKNPIAAVKRAIALAFVITLVSTGTAFAVTKNVAGGTWDYGTNYAIGTAWSSFWHPSKNHAASLMIGASNRSSGCEGPRETASVTAWRPPFTSVSYHYRFC